MIPRVLGFRVMQILYGSRAGVWYRWSREFLYVRFWNVALDPCTLPVEARGEGFKVIRTPKP